MSRAVEVVPQCPTTYTRPEVVRGADSPPTIRCTYVAGHPKPEHSWWGLSLQDEAAIAAARRARRDRRHDWGEDVPNDVAVLLSNIADGELDAHLEALLAVAHNRKRTLRGTAGFARGGQV